MGTVLPCCVSISRISWPLYKTVAFPAPNMNHHPLSFLSLLHALRRCSRPSWVPTPRHPLFLVLCRLAVSVSLRLIRPECSVSLQDGRIVYCFCLPASIEVSQHDLMGVIILGISAEAYAPPRSTTRLTRSRGRPLVTPLTLGSLLTGDLYELGF
jgi:hypothetical protein